MPPSLATRATPTGPLTDPDTGEITSAWRYALTGLSPLIAAATAFVSALPYGVAGDGATDNSLALQKWLDALVRTGGTGFLPAGKYNFSTPLTIDQSALTSWLAGTRVSLLGAGNGATILNYTGTTGQALTYTGSTTGSGIEGLFSFEGIFLKGPNLAGSTKGVVVNKAAHFSMKDVTITGFGTGLQLTDAFSCYFLGCAWTFNGLGVAAAYAGFSDPNAISFYSCEIGNNLSGGLNVSNPTTVNYFGGAIEGNGFAGTSGSRYGVFVANASTGGAQGVVGANFYGTYFEANAQTADIWLTEGGTAGPSSVTCIGCTFNRISGTAGQFSTNNIRLDLVGSGASRAKLTLLGNGFAGFNSYVPNAGRPYVIVNAGGATAYEVIDFGNLYNAPLEAPAYTGLQRTQAAMASGWASFSGATGAIIDSYNVSSVTRTAAGSYTIVFADTLTHPNYATVVTHTGPGFSTVVSAAAAGPIITTTTPAGVLNDFGVVSVVCFGGGSP